MLKMLATAIMIRTTAAQAPSFDEYNKYVDARPVQRNFGCLSASDWINGEGRAEIAKMICDQNENCTQYGDYSATKIGFNAWTAAPGTITYISTKRCGDDTVEPGKVVQPSCAAKKDAPKYFACTEGTAGGKLTALATFQLPPALIYSSCNQNSRCVAFTTDTDGSTGTLYRYDDSTTNNASNIKIQSQNARPRIQVARRRYIHPECNGNNDPLCNYVHIPDGGVTLAKNAVFDRCSGSSPAPHAFMNETTYKRICELYPANCNVFYDAPVADASVYQMTADPTAPAQSLYLNSSVCVPDFASCAAENSSALTFLKCKGLDVTQPTLVETYDLPLMILAQVCQWKGCHAFTARADNSSGSLYMFANSTSASDSFYRLPVEPATNA